MTQWIDVCSVDDLQPDSGVCALIDGRQIAVFYMSQDQAIYAIDNFDPFGKANVLSRGLIGKRRVTNCKNDGTRHQERRRADFVDHSPSCSRQK